VRRRWWLPLVVVALVGGWIGLALTTTGGADAHEFRTTTAKAAQGALSAVRTAWLSGQADLDGRITQEFLSPVLDNAAEGVATAQRQLTRTPPPGDAEAGTRDALASLLDDAARATADLIAAVERGDNGALRAVVDALGTVGDRLAAFVEGHQP
jgi:hypothetical protein